MGQMFRSMCRLFESSGHKITSCDEKVPGVGLYGDAKISYRNDHYIVQATRVPHGNGTHVVNVSVSQGKLGRALRFYSLSKEEQHFSIVVVGGWHHFGRHGNIYFFDGGKLNSSEGVNIPALSVAIDTIMRELANAGFTGLLVFCSYSPSHFGGGFYDSGGTCDASRPSNKTPSQTRAEDLAAVLALLEEKRAHPSLGFFRGQQM